MPLPPIRLTSEALGAGQMAEASLQLPQLWLHVTNDSAYELAPTPLYLLHTIWNSYQVMTFHNGTDMT